MNTKKAPAVGIETLLQVMKNFFITFYCISLKKN